MLSENDNGDLSYDMIADEIQVVQAPCAETGYVTAGVKKRTSTAVAKKRSFSHCEQSEQRFGQGEFGLGGGFGGPSAPLASSEFDANGPVDSGFQQGFGKLLKDGHEVSGLGLYSISPMQCDDKFFFFQTAAVEIHPGDQIISTTTLYLPANGGLATAKAGICRRSSLNRSHSEPRVAANGWTKTKPYTLMNYLLTRCFTLIIDGVWLLY